MNFLSFEYFKVLCEHRNFTKAAKSLYISQQSLSSHIASLEKELGVALFDRTTPLKLTHAGRVFEEYVTGFLAERDEMLKKIGIPEKRLAVILKTVNFDELEFKDGKFSKEDTLEKDAKEEWADFIVTAKETGVDSANPPENNGGKEKAPSRAAELARRYQEQMYGKVEEKK